MSYINNINEEDLIYTLAECLLSESKNNEELVKRISECYLIYDTYLHEYAEYEERGYILQIPEHSINYFNEAAKQKITDLINSILSFEIDFLTFKILPKVAPDNWRKETMSLGINNQIAFPSTNFPLIQLPFILPSNSGRHITIKFRSPAEEILFSYFFNAGCLFFPCPLGFSNKFNDPYYKEPDYLVCSNGKWAILEVVKDSTHSSVEYEAKRTRQYQDNLIHIRQFDYQKCMSHPADVVKDFLEWLGKI